MHRKVEILVELQVQDEGEFLYEFSLQPNPSQSGSKSYNESDIEFDNEALVNDSSNDSDQDSVISKHRMDVRKSERVPPVQWMLDPTSLD